MDRRSGMGRCLRLASRPTSYRMVQPLHLAALCLFCLCLAWWTTTTGYNPKLQLSASSFEHTVVVMHYTDTDNAAGIGQGLLSQPVNVLYLHGGGSNSNDTRYRLITWFQGSAEKSLLAIASTAQVEVWEITAPCSTSGITATLRGSVDINRPQRLVWNPRYEVLLVHSKTDVLLINSTQSTLSWRTIHINRSTYQPWGACSWSPCGLQVSLAQNHVLHCFSWTNIDSLLSESPRHDQVDVTGILGSVNELQLDGGNTSVGHIAAIARVSPTICIFTTDTKLVLEDLSRAAPALNYELRETISIGKPTSSNVKICLDTQEQAVTLSSGIIDLTSIRASTSSTQNSLQILNRTENTSARRNLPHGKPCSHMLIAEYEAEQWSVKSILDLPQLASPDILVVQKMRVIVGSTLAPRLVMSHLNVSDRMEWTASLSGELELPPTHVCRGIYLADVSPFVDIASTEKHKRTIFFHAAVDIELHPIYLSRFKVPRREQPNLELKPAVQGSSTITAGKTSDGDIRTGGKTQDILELILTKMTAMQTQMNDRFDNVDKKLQQLTTRVEQLERNGGTSAK